MQICFLAHNFRNDNGGGILARNLFLGISKSLRLNAVALATVPSNIRNEQAILFPSKWKLVSVFFKIRKIIRASDVVHAMDVYPYGIIAMLVSIGLNKKIIITAVGTGSILPLYRPLQALFSKIAFGRADRLVAISRFTRDEIHKKIPSLSIDIINPAIDHGELASESVDAQIARFVALKPYILSVGAIRKRKGYEYGLRAFAEALKSKSELNYVIIGKSSSHKYFESLKNVTKELGIEKRVHFLDTVSDRAKLYAAYKEAELFCLFSQNDFHDVEGFGIVFLEAAAFGLPVVGTGNCGIDDAMWEGENGFLVRNNDPKDFASAIIKILSDPLLRESMSKKSLELARISDWSDRIEKYSKVYHSIGIHGA